MKRLIYILVILNIGSLTAQTDSVLLTKNFKFNDGVYLTFEALRKNRPDYSWDEVEAELATNPKTFTAKIIFIRPLEDNGERALDLNEIWGVAIGGIPFIRVDGAGAGEDAFKVFAGLKVRGKICYFSFETEVTKMVRVSAYNPLTGKPFRSALVPTKELVVHQKMLDFADGAILDFTLENLLEWVSDDWQLTRALETLSPEEAQEKLFKCLLIYDDRHEVYLVK